MSEIAVVERAPMTVQEHKTQINTIQKVLKDVMKKDVHYGTIPGTQKPTLLKPGAEKILATFHIAIDPIIEDLSGPDEIRYRIKVRGLSMNGIFLGSGVGECSSSEEKYRWRSAVCDKEFEETDDDRRRTKYGRRGRDGHYEVKQVRTNPSDMANTVLKMAKKRALVDLCLTVTGASDVFDQDLEDLPSEYVEEHISGASTGGKPAVEQPIQNGNGNGGGKVATKGQVDMLQSMLDRSGKSAAELCDKFGVQALAELPIEKVNDAIKFAKAAA